MPKKAKFNKDTQYYIEESTKSILKSIAEDASDLDLIGHKKDKKISS